MLRPIAQAVSALSLLGTLGTPLAYLAGGLDLDQLKLALLLSTVAWFVATPLWMGRKPAAKPVIGAFDD